MFYLVHWFLPVLAELVCDFTCSCSCRTGIIHWLNGELIKLLEIHLQEKT